MNESKDAINDPLISRDQNDTSHFEIPVSSFANHEEQTNFRSKMQKSGFFSYVHILFTVSTLSKANKLSKTEQMLKDEDIPALGFNERTEELEKRFMKNYEDIKRKKGHVTIAQAAMKTFRKEVVLVFFLDAIYKALRVLIAWLLWKLLNVLTTGGTLEQCFIWTGIMGGVLVLASYFEQHWMFLAIQTGIRFRSALIKMVYSKLTKISVHSLNDLSIGKIVNVVANDVNIFERRSPFFSSVYLGIPTLLGAIFVLYNLFSYSSLVGIFYMIFSIPIQGALVKASTKPQVQKNAITDERVKLTSEMIDSIKLLKMYAWENVFSNIIKALRNKEISLLKTSATYEAIARGIALSITALASFLIFVVYTLVEGGELKIYKVFPTLFLMGFIRIHVIFYTLNGFGFKAEVNLLFQRIQQIFDAQEINEKTFEAPLDLANSVEFRDFSGYWSKIPEKQNLDENAPVPKEALPAIANLDLELKRGSMNAIVGTVGGGKSSLLLAFTGEMPSTTGHLAFSGQVAYAEQEPTIFPGLLRDNILFGRGYRPVFYNEVVKACCLENDFKQLPNGDQTEIGEKGVNLSGGQKARIALARAIYSEADIYLLDDPLSAVDAKVAKKLYEDAILGMLKGKTVLLVTHQVHFVKDLASIIVMQDGRIAGHGNYAELKEQHVDVEGIFSTERSKNSRTSFGLDSSILAALNNKQSVTASYLQNFRPMSVEEVEAEEEELENLKKNEELQDEKAKLVAPEDPRSAKVTAGTYCGYINAIGNKFFVFIVALIFFGSVASDLVFARYIGLWAKGTLEKPYMIIGILSGVIFVAYMLKSIFYYNIVLTGSKNLHNKMIDRIVNNPPEFFDSNPVGRILNRFSNDVGVLDKALPLPQEDVLGISFAFFAMMVAIAVINPKTLGPIVIGCIFIWLITRFCQEGVKQTKIYELTSRSPVYSLFSTTLAGLISIRSYGQTDQFQKSFSKLMNKNLKAGVSFVSNNQFLGISIDLTYTLISIATIIFLFYFRGTTDDQSLIGFSLCYILILNGMLQYNFRTMVQYKILMSSTARILNYCNSKSELPAEMRHDHELQSQKWPQAGAIEFNNVKMRYREGADYVLKGVTFKARPGEKIGCVGRTGAGKSSIIQALFRMVEIEKENSDSCIKIDGVDTQQVGLHLLRDNISIIPQIPVVFSGTIRRNLDPLEHYTDAELWEVLNEVKLKEYVENIEGQLRADMSNSASMFSVGQKQLICLARAILKKSKIVVLDEATANVDTQTDNFIQQKIMERFANCTVFTIAHRLSTIANYDKILVLDHGQVVEFDSPYKLLVNSESDKFITNKLGHFASMVLNTGQRASYNIYKKAKAKYEQQRQQLQLMNGAGTGVGATA